MQLPEPAESRGAGRDALSKAPSADADRKGERGGQRSR